ncbi:hypothetical protein AYL99_05185 [Fonsecaea erecta]|uniref:Uncharacterized protein n=1 Tax=Fonsecaea erecta TaxID=1367422 RepID=A0A178ZLU2_9EURO|nr:hypothetical protein AYL99_05185 [Fonsecaea erecta]OAP60183.1 hypothetical protein AYL99_05185 [Fonsecaea erecta]
MSGTGSTSSLSPNTSAGLTGGVEGVRPCCVRCAQLYVAFPTLRCDPWHEDLKPRKGVMRAVTYGCHNCRTFRHKCVPVPQTHHDRLRQVQTEADKYATAKRRTLGFKEFCDLRRAQQLFSAACRPGGE